MGPYLCYSNSNSLTNNAINYTIHSYKQRLLTSMTRVRSEISGTIIITKDNYPPLCRLNTHVSKLLALKKIIKL